MSAIPALGLTIYAIDTLFHMNYYIYEYFFQFLTYKLAVLKSETDHFFFFKFFATLIVLSKNGQKHCGVISLYDFRLTFFNVSNVIYSECSIIRHPSPSQLIRLRIKNCRINESNYIAKYGSSPIKYECRSSRSNAL